MSKARAAETLKELLSSPDERVRLDAAKSLLRAGRGKEKRSRTHDRLPEGVTRREFTTPDGRKHSLRIYPPEPPADITPRYATKEQAEYLLARADELEQVENLDATIFSYLREDSGTPPTQREVDDHVAYLREEAASIQEILDRQ